MTVGDVSLAAGMLHRFTGTAQIAAVASTQA